MAKILSVYDPYATCFKVVRSRRVGSETKQFSPSFQLPSLLMNTPFSELITARLLLKTVTIADIEEVLFLRSDQEVNRYIFRKEKVEMPQALAFIERVAKGVANQNFYYWGITQQGNPKMIGSICLWNISEDRSQAELGYDLHPDFQGLGIMSEAMEAVLDFGFQQMGLDKLEAFTHNENQASKKLLERNGFVHLSDRVDDGHKWNWIYRKEKK